MNPVIAKMKLYAMATRLGFKTNIHYVFGNKILVTFVSENFDGFCQEDRIKLTGRAFNLHSPELMKHYKLIMELFTPKEQREYET